MNYAVGQYTLANKLAVMRFSNFWYHDCTGCAIVIPVGETASLIPKWCPQRSEDCCGHDGTYPPACPEGVADGEEPACQYRSWTPIHSLPSLTPEAQSV